MPVSLFMLVVVRSLIEVNYSFLVFSLTSLSKETNLVTVLGLD